MMRSSFGWLFTLLGLVAHPQASAEGVDPIARMIESIREWAPTCDGSISKQDCDDEHSTLWNGLVCSSNPDAFERICYSVRLSQDGSGRIWRSPRRVGVEGKDSFSRYVAMGVLFYLVATNDTDLATLWMKYIREEGGLCPDGPFSNCAIKGHLNDAFRLVYEYLGLQHLLPYDIANARDTFGWAFEARTTATGEPLHYLALHLLLRKRLGMWNNELQKAADILQHRQNQNLLFVLLSDGRTPDLCNRILGLSPVAVPSSLTEWTWERCDAEQAWKKSMGWEFIFLGQACL